MGIRILGDSLPLRLNCAIKMDILELEFHQRIIAQMAQVPICRETGKIRTGPDTKINFGGCGVTRRLAYT